MKEDHSVAIKSLTSLKKADGIGETIKLGVGFAVGIAADVAITVLMKGHLPVTKGLTKWMVKLGIFAIGMKVGEDMETYFYKVCDDVKDTYNEAKEEAKKAVAEAIEEEEGLEKAK
jgi:hypothetical protein